MKTGVIPFFNTQKSNYNAYQFRLEKYRLNEIYSIALVLLYSLKALPVQHLA